jgi:phosphatidylglycerophosphate synthase
MAVLLNGAVTLAFVAFTNRRARERVMTRANLLTLSRAGSAAVLAGTAASPGLARRRAWLALLWGGPSDWLDGPLARRDGATELGALLDVEADSWLILWAAMAAWRIGELPWWSAAPPVLRYVIPAVQARGRHHRPLDRPWQRMAAGLQTSALTLALAPARRLNRVGRAIAPMAAIAQLAAMASTIRELRRRSRSARAQ